MEGFDEYEKKIWSDLEEKLNKRMESVMDNVEAVMDKRVSDWKEKHDERMEKMRIELEEKRKKKRSSKGDIRDMEEQRDGDGTGDGGNTLENGFRRFIAMVDQIEAKMSGLPDKNEKKELRECIEIFTNEINTIMEKCKDGKGNHEEILSSCEELQESLKSFTDILDNDVIFITKRDDLVASIRTSVDSIKHFNDRC